MLNIFKKKNAVPVKKQVPEKVQPDCCGWKDHSMSVFRDSCGLMSTGVVVKPVENGAPGFASVTIDLMEGAEEFRDIAVFNKHGEVVATKEDIGFIGVAVDLDRCGVLCDHLQSIDTEIRYNLNRFFDYTTPIDNGKWVCARNLKK